MYWQVSFTYTANQGNKAKSAVCFAPVSNEKATRVIYVLIKLFQKGQLMTLQNEVIQCNYPCDNQFMSNLGLWDAADNKNWINQSLQQARSLGMEKYIDTKTND